MRLLDGIVTCTTLFFLVYRTFGGQGVCLAGRYVHKYHMRPVGSGHYARQPRLRQQDHRNLWLEKKKGDGISVFILVKQSRKTFSGNTCRLSIS